MKFLVVDDSATMRRIVVNSLQRIGFTEILEAANGEEALERFDASVGFVITDWKMPRMSGIDFARALRARHDGRDVPILMVTPSAKEDITTAMQAGVNTCIVKPFTLQMLKDRIEQMLATTPAAPLRHVYPTGRAVS